MFIEGKEISSEASSDNERLAITNPSNGRMLYELHCGTAETIAQAVSSSRQAFEDGRWSDQAPAFRKRALLRLATLIQDRAAELDALDAEEMGKPISTAFCNAHSAGEFVRFYAEAADKVQGDVFGSDKHSYVTQRRIPYGVVAAIAPWNFPTFCAVLKAAPALAAGNCVVLKPSEMSSRSSGLIARLAFEAGLPPGVLNVVPGLGATIGPALVSHEDVDMVTFTGSTNVGRQILQYAALSNMKPVLAECGGKSPHIVFDDGVDIDAASMAIAGAILTNQGQICSVGTRLLVQRSIQSRMVEAIAAQMKAVAIGDALDPQTSFGPIASAKQCARVMGYIEGAMSAGTPLATGGKRTCVDTGGFYVEPTLFYDVSPEARIAQEEIFGPVLSVIPFDSEDEAVRIAKGTGYGLAATIWTASLTAGMRLAKALRSSVVVNAEHQKGEGAGFAASHEPTGLSGFGAEGGLAGMESYMRRQLMWFNHG